MDLALQVVLGARGLQTLHHRLAIADHHQMQAGVGLAQRQHGLQQFGVALGFAQHGHAAHHDVLFIESELGAHACAGLLQCLPG
ncbi:hypothetical protein D3C81_754280 [compost metagenome]